jgi:GT2 family glycosyltransferase
VLNVSVVVPILNAVRTLPFCLAALEKLQPAPREVILVDNGSSDGSLELIQRYAQHDLERTRIIQEPRRGVSVARNAGIRSAQGEIIAFTDSDCAAEADWLMHLHKPFSDAAVGAVAGRVLGHSSRAPIELFSSLYTFQTSDEVRRHSTWSPWAGGYPTANLAVRRHLLEELNGFDEGFQTGEDYDLCARLYGRGCSLIYIPKARVVHQHRTSLQGLLRQAFGFGRAHAQLLQRHVPKGLWLEFPRCSFTWSACPISAWIDGASPDKKLVALLGLGLLYAPCWGLPLLYSAWLVGAAKRRAARAGHSISVVLAGQLAALLVLKASAMTAGRWYGAVGHRVVCG